MSQFESQLAPEAPSARPCSGRDVAQLLNDLAGWFAGYVDHLNALNVFPVPDGDTGTNMAQTLRSAAEALPSDPQDVAEVLQSAARGALMGASGNSGVILSQMIRGFSDACRQTETLDDEVLKRAFTGAARAGYASVAKPVEGTMLTVARRAAESAAEATGSVEVFGRALAGASRAVTETPQQLEQLRAAGVIDAGGEGLRLILDGVYRWLCRQPLERAALAPAASRALVGIQHTSGESGYCTQFLIERSSVGLSDVRARLDGLGHSLVVVEAEELIRVHVHADRPGMIIDQAASLGRLRNVSIENMDLQHEGAASPSLDGSSNIGIVTVAQSAESARLFTNLGAARVIRIEGGESPTVDQMLSAVQSIGYEHVLLLPNNENALLAAEQARDLSPRSIAIIATRNVAEAVACMVAFNYVGDVDENVAGMREALRRLETLDVARATRAAAYPHVKVEVGDCVVLSRGEVASSAPALGAAMRGVLTYRRDDAPELITIYTGAEASVDALECIRTAVSEQWPAAEIQIVDTRQPRRLAILALE